MPTPSEDEAKRAAERTGVVTVTVIYGLLAAGLVALLVADLSHRRSAGGFIWVGLVGFIAMTVQLVRMWRRNIRSRRTPPTAP